MKNDDPRGELDPQVQALFTASLAARPAERVFDAATMQGMDDGMAMFLNMDAPPTPAPVEIQIPGPDGPIRALVFTPEGTAGSVLPVLMYIHGGGFVVMGPETHARLTKLLATGAQAIVVSIDYRRSPQHPYPAPLDDCVAAYRWLREHAASLGGDPLRIAIGGDSAGGNLTAATMLRLQADGDAQPRAAMLLCAWTDLALDTPSYKTFGPGDPILDTLVLEYFRESYVPNAEQWADPFVSPLHGDLSKFPPTCVVIGGIDPLRDDSVQFVEKLRAAGREVDEQLYEGMPHDFMFWMPRPAATQVSIDAMCKFLKRWLA